jgi:palmitoyltransferase
MSILAYHLYIRVMVIWDNRKLPSYLGPSLWSLSHLVVLCVVNGFTLFALSLLLLQTTHAFLFNTTMIEGWEIDRHTALVERARKQGGYVYANGGQRLRIEQQEFPYDIGHWKNMCQAMGTGNILFWFMPFGGGPTIQSAGNWEVNGFEEDDKTWPPPDPDKMPRRERPIDGPLTKEFGTVEEEREAFRQRQEQDHQRWSNDHSKPNSDEEEDEYEVEEGIDGEQGWTNSDGDRLRDYGVDEEAEVFSDDEDIPLGELLRRRKARPFE